MKKQHNEPYLFAFQYKEFTVSTILYGNLIIPLALVVEQTLLLQEYTKINPGIKFRAVQ